MPFAADRDLLIIEPTLFRDVAWLGQRLLEGVADLAGSTMTLTTYDHDLAALDIRPGAVVLANDVPHEITEILGPTDATISRIRADRDDPLIAPGASPPLTVEIHSFRPQLEMIHRQVLRMAGIEPSDAGADVTTDNITNPAALRAVESHGALHLIYSAAAALGGDDSPLASRARLHRAIFGIERQRALVELDLDGDGLPDATRRLNAIQFVRA